jgi:tetratricopeptide (TPR) repeat protein
MKRSTLLALAGLIAAAASPAAHAQYAAEVYGVGYARDCYETVRSKRGLPQRAIDICTQALLAEDMTARTRAATFNNRGIAHMRDKNHDAATRDYNAALRITPDIAETQINFGAMLYYEGMYAEAVAALDEGVKAEDTFNRAAAHYNRALSLEMLGRLEAAYADYRTALRLRPGFAQAEQQLRRFTVTPG